MDVLLQQRTLNNYLLKTLCALLGAFAAFITVTTLSILITSHWHGPFRDMWEIFPFLEKIINGSWGFSDLWEPYGNSHRMFIPKLLFVADYQFFNANNHLLIFISVICQIIICGLFSLSIFKDNQLPILNKCIFIFIAVCLNFSGTLLFNLMHTFDVQWFLCCLFVTAAFIILSAVESDKQSLVYLKIGISAVLIFLACLNNFSGMVAWIIWLGVIVAKTTNKKQIFMWSTFCFMCVTILSYGVKSAGINQAGWLVWLKLLFYFTVWFPTYYLSNPLSYSDYPIWNYCAAALVIYSLMFVFRFWWKLLVLRKPVDSNLKLFLACVALFGFGVSLVTAIGRGYDPAHVHAMRYQNIVMLFWSAVIPFIVLETDLFTLKYKILLRTPLAVVLVGFLSYQYSAWSENRWLGYQVNRAHLALMMGFSRDVPMIAPTVSRSMIYVAGYNLERERALHERAEKGIYAGSLAESWLKGVSLAAITEKCEEVSWSVTEQTTPYTHYIDFTVYGDLKDYTEGYLVNESGKVVAVAIPEVAKSQRTFWAQSGPGGRRLKGFSLQDNKKSALALVLKNKTGTQCKDV